MLTEQRRAIGAEPEIGRVAEGGEPARPTSGSAGWRRRCTKIAISVPTRQQHNRRAKSGSGAASDQHASSAETLAPIVSGRQD